LEGPRKLKIFVLVYAFRAVKWQIVWLVCKNQDTVAVQNVSTCYLELRRPKNILNIMKTMFPKGLNSLMNYYNYTNALMKKI
jgi:hypothetical protein